MTVEERKKMAAKTKEAVESIFLTLPEKERKMMGFIHGEKEYLTVADSKRLIARFVYKKGNTPISCFDLMDVGTEDLNAVVITRYGKSYRGKGYATKCVNQGIEWWMKNRGNLRYKHIVWWAESDNKGSQKVAEKCGFIMDAKGSKQYKGWFKYIF